MEPTLETHKEWIAAHKLFSMMSKLGVADDRYLDEHHYTDELKRFVLKRLYK